MRVKFVGSHYGAVLRHWLLQYILVHRLSLATYDRKTNPNPIPDDELTGEMINYAFTKTPLGIHTGYERPYHAAVLHNANVDQLLPLTVKGAHCGGYNWRSLSVCVVGDTTKRAPQPGQLESLIEVCQAWAPAHNGLEVVGHTEIKPRRDKVCPGPFLDLNAVRAAVMVCDRLTSWPTDAQAMGFEL